MLGLMYLGAAAIFLVVLLFVVVRAWLLGRANGGSWQRGLAFATVGFLVVYLPVFWNWIPVVVAHKHLCEADAGFVAYKPPEQWVAENRDQFPALSGVDLEKTTKSRDLASGFSRYEFFGGLLAREGREERSYRYGMDFWRRESRIIDVRTNGTLTRRVNYSVGSRDDARIWLTRQSCFSPDTAQPSDYEQGYKLKLKGSQVSSLVSALRHLEN